MPTAAATKSKKKIKQPLSIGVRSITPQDIIRHYGVDVHQRFLKHHEKALNALKRGSDVSLLHTTGHQALLALAKSSSKSKGAILSQAEWNEGIVKLGVLLKATMEMQKINPGKVNEVVSNYVNSLKQLERPTSLGELSKLCLKHKITE
ncbi:hypothetical protein HUU53_00615 [Candidatus Micrarchaeota archaeon]|nr:hypothetical protein [Candidatus Micrarchaeota archaeon]